MGTNSIPDVGLPLEADQLYHHETPGVDAVGAKPEEGAAFVAMPRLHGGAPPSGLDPSESTGAAASPCSNPFPFPLSPPAEAASGFDGAASGFDGAASGPASGTSWIGSSLFDPQAASTTPSTQADSTRRVNRMMR